MEEYVLAELPHRVFHGSLWQEYIWPYDFDNYQEAKAVIYEAFWDYNYARLRSALRYVSSRTGSWHYGRLGMVGQSL